MPFCWFCHEVAPVFTEYDWKSGEFSTWTESSWAVDAQDMRLFLIPSKTFEVRHFALLSFLSVWW